MSSIVTAETYTQVHKICTCNQVHTTILTNGNNQLVPVHYIKTTQYTHATHKIDLRDMKSKTSNSTSRYL